MGPFGLFKALVAYIYLLLLEAIINNINGLDIVIDLLKICNKALLEILIIL
jgi:hypothetical protein